MTAYGRIDFNGRKILHDIVYPVYYFVHGSFDNERTQLEGNVISFKEKYMFLSSVSYARCRYDNSYTGDICISYAFR